MRVQLALLTDSRGEASVLIVARQISSHRWYHNRSCDTTYHGVVLMQELACLRLADTL